MTWCVRPVSLALGPTSTPHSVLQVPFNDQPDSYQCLTCQGPKSGFVEADENSAPAPPVEVAVDLTPPAPTPPSGPPRTRVTIKELTTEDPWVKYTRGRKLGGGTFGEVHEAVCKVTVQSIALHSVLHLTG